MDRLGSPHPGLGADAAHPIREARDEAEVFAPCCSPISRTGTTRPVEIVIVGPKKRSSMKMPSA
jgi:hypothetical protein